MNAKETERIFGEKLQNYSTPIRKAALLIPTTNEEYIEITDMMMADKPEAEIAAALERLKKLHQN